MQSSVAAAAGSKGFNRSFLRRKVASGQAVITTVAGTTTTAGFSGDGGPARSAELNLPSDVAVDTSGNMYIVDYGNNRVRRVSAAGIITTVAGNGASGSAGDGGAAIAASLNGPVAIAVDHNGNLFIAERYRVRKVNPAGAITTYAGGGSLTTDGVATNTYMQPAGVAVDSAGVLYIADKSYGIRKVSTGGIITTIIGGRFGFSGDGGAATSATLNAPTGVTVDGMGNIYFADSGNNRIRKINSSGVISTLAGTGTQGFSGDGGPATSAKIGLSIASPHQGLATDSSGNLYFADVANNRVRRVDKQGIITTLAGNGLVTFNLGDGGLSTNASLGAPLGVAADASGRVLIADTRHAAIRAIGINGGAGVAVLPAIAPGGIVNTASGQPGVAANSWVTIYGTNLAATTQDWSNSIDSGKLPTTLAGVSVMIGNKRAYMSFVSPTQLNVLAPDALTGVLSVTVTTSAGTSSAGATTAALYEPALFSWPHDQAVATHQDFSYAAKAGTFSGVTAIPAKPGEVILLWGTGFGPTNPPVPVGSVVPSGQMYSTVTLPSVTIGNMPATVLESALEPGAAGVYRIAVQVPNAIGDGDWPIQAGIAGVVSPSGVMLSVRR